MLIFYKILTNLPEFAEILLNFDQMFSEFFQNAAPEGMYTESGFYFYFLVFNYFEGLIKIG